MSKHENQFSEVNKLLYIDYCKRIDSLNMQMYHYHDSYEIYFMLSGQRNYFIKDRTYFVIKGDIVLININDLHKTTVSGSHEHERVVINFKKDYLSGITDIIKDVDVYSCFNQNLNIIRMNLNEQNFIQTLLSKMIEESKKQLQGYETYLKIMLLELLLFLNRYLENSQPKYFDYPSSMHKKVSEIVKYINASYMNNLTLQDISEKFFISTCYSSRIFKSITGFSFIEYLNSIRIKEAQKLLQNSKLNVTEISEKVGYESITNFGRVFKTITGVSPLKYKKDINSF